MKKLISIMFCLVLLLSGCSKNDYENGELDVFIPGEYISEEVVSMFEDEYHVKVNITTFESNESMYTKLALGTVYDVIIPSDYMAERLINEKMVQSLDKSKITNISTLYDGVKNLEFDPNNDYSIPYFWGNVGIVYDGDIVSESDVVNEGWAVLKNPKYAGQIYMYDSIRDVFMIALKSLGYSMNTNNTDEINEAYQWLLDIAENMDPAYAADECIDGLAYGEKAMGIMYSGDAAAILSEHENMRFYAPSEGTNYWVDVMMIHKDAKNVENALKFINFIISYDASYMNSEYVGYASVNKEVLTDLTLKDEGIYDGNEAYLPRERTVKDEEFHNDEETLKVISELWVKVKNQ